MPASYTTARELVVPWSMAMVIRSSFIAAKTFPRSWKVLTGISAGPDGWLYVCEFGPLPYFEGTGDILRLRPSGEVETVMGGLTTPVSAQMMPDGTMYVLEFSAPLRQVPNSGRVLRFSPDGERTVIAVPPR